MKPKTRLQHEAKGPWEMVRRVRLPELGTTADAQQVRSALNGVPGIQEIAIDLHKRRLMVRYDVNRMDYGSLLRLLKNAGFPAASGLLDRVRTSLYQYADTNARDNAKAPPPPCCNKPPR